jgi:hypothetical protein
MVHIYEFIIIINLKRILFIQQEGKEQNNFKI